MTGKLIFVMETLEHILQSKNIVFKEADLHISLKPNDLSCSQPICPGDGCPALRFSGTLGNFDLQYFLKSLRGLS